MSEQAGELLVLDKSAISGAESTSVRSPSLRLLSSLLLSGSPEAVGVGIGWLVYSMLTIGEMERGATDIMASTTSIDEDSLIGGFGEAAPVDRSIGTASSYDGIDIFSRISGSLYFFYSIDFIRFRYIGIVCQRELSSL